MMDNLILRVERPEDHAAIYALTAAAFADMPYAGGDEQDVVNRLRDAGALHLSLVAVLDDKLVGQATFSPAENADGSGPWYALGPISVDPALQGRGIGGRLINAGIAQLKPALGCILTGNPDYYQRFGYEAAPEYAAENEPAEYFMVKWLNEMRPEGRFRFHPAFYGEVGA